LNADAAVDDDDVVLVELPVDALAEVLAEAVDVVLVEPCLLLAYRTAAPAAMTITIRIATAATLEIALRSVLRNYP